MKKNVIVLILLLAVQIPLGIQMPGQGLEFQNETISIAATTIFTQAPPDRTIEQGLGDSFTWKWAVGPSVLDHFNFTAYRNETFVYGEQNKQNPKQYIDQNNLIDGSQAPGIYNLSLVLSVLYNNGTYYQEMDSVFVTVVAQAAPDIYSAPNSPLQAEEGTLSTYLQWSVYEVSPNIYSIYKNGTVPADADAVALNQLDKNITISYQDYNVTVGETYNYTIIFTDDIGLQSQNTTIVTVIENPVPTIEDTTSDEIFAKSDTSKSYSWTFQDNDLQNYTIFVDSVSYRSNVFNGTSSIVELDLNFLDYGEYNITIVTQDSFDQTIADTVNIAIIDIINPDIQSAPADQTLYYGQGIANLIWNVVDDNNATYKIYRNGSLRAESTWSSGINIVFQTDINPVVATFNITIVLTDSYGNSITDTVWITILAIATNTPSVSVTSNVYVDSIDQLTGSWTTELDSLTITGASVIATITKDGQVVETINGLIDSSGNIQLDIFYEDYQTGIYTIKLSFTKVGYEERTISQVVEVFSSAIQSSLIFGSSLVQGEVFSILVNLTYGEISSALTPNLIELNQLSYPTGPVKFTQVSLNLTYTDISGKVVTQLFTATTDANGIATIEIAASITAKISKLGSYSISAGEQSYTMTTSSSNIELSSISIIRNSGVNPGNQTNQPVGTDLTVIIVIVLLVLAFIGVAGYFIFVNPLQRIEPIDHIDHLQSIQMIILSNSNGIPIFEKSFSELDTDSTMIAGLSTAISTFLDEFIENKDKGLEVIERDNLSLISHRSTNTVFTIVSSPKLPNSYQNQIITTHTELIDDIPQAKLEQTYSSSNDNLDVVVLNSLHNNGIRVNLLFKINFSSDRFKEYLEFGAPNMPSIVAKNRDLLMNLNLINISLVEYFTLVRSQTELEDDRIADLLFALDDLGLISTKVNGTNGNRF